MIERLSELAQVAKKNDRGGGKVAWNDRGMDVWSHEEATFIRACSPDTLLRLVAVVQAGTKLAEEACESQKELLGTLSSPPIQLDRAIADYERTVLALTELEKGR